MAAALFLTCLEKIGEGFMSGIGGLLVAPIKQQYKYLCCFSSHITELETKLRDLEATRQVVQTGADEIRNQARDVRRDIEEWLKSVNGVTTEVKGIIRDMEKVEEGCLNGWCFNLKLRYSLSMQAVKKTKVLIDLKDVGVQYTQTLPSYSSPLPGLETITNRDFMGFESRSIIMEEIINALKHDEINLIGVCGMGGVGKTTMVNEVAKRAKEDNHFDEVAIAVVSQEPNQTNVQACIADMLGLTNLRDKESPIARADLLRKRLLQDNKKALVILDDIWAEFDLKALGIPLESADKNFKVLYTSRTRHLWHEHQQTKKEIPLEPLLEDEAWQLFKEKAGVSADARDLQPIAKQIVKKCGCLPLALALIGSALSKELLKGCGRNAIKIWNGMLDRLTCATNIPADKQLSSCMELSYKCLEDEAKSLFLLCCLFEEDEHIHLEDLARYGFGLSLFDGMNQMGKVRDRVVLIVNDLKSRYLLLDSGNKEECVKVHDVVRAMGISIASKERDKDISILSKDKFALVSHGPISQWPKTAAHEHYTAISVISDEIEEPPEGLTYSNLEFLMLRCRKKLPPNFFGGMGKLKVLELRGFCGILTLQSLRNLTTLSLEGFGGTLDNVSVMGDLQNLETLSFCGSKIKELPEEIGKLVQLRLLDLRRTSSLTRIQPGVISRLVRLEELYFLDSEYSYWEGEGKEGEVRNANLGEFESLSNLNTLEIYIRSDVIIPKVPIFSKLKIYRVVIADEVHFKFRGYFHLLTSKFERMLWVGSSIPIPSNRGGIDSLLRNSDWLSLRGEGCNDLVRELLLRDMLKQLTLRGRLPNLREICWGPVPAGSFEELTSIEVYDCERLENLFKLPIEGCLTRQEDVHVAINNIIVFPKLEVLNLYNLPRLVDFCRGIDQIDFPQLKRLYLQKLGGFNRLFDNNCNLASNSEQNDNVGFLSFFPRKVSLPNLEELRVDELQNLERLGHGPLSVGSLSKLKDFSVCHCGKLLCVFPSQLVPMLRELQKLTVECCNSLEVVFELEGLESNEPNQEILKLQVAELQNLEILGHGSLSVGSFAKLKEFSVRDCGKLLCVFPSQFLPMLHELQELTVERCDSLEVVFELEGLESNEPNQEILSPLKFVKLLNLPKLNCISKSYPVGFKYIHTLEIHKCNSLSYVFAPTTTKSIPQLLRLKISSCEMLSRIVAEENALGESLVDEVEFPQLESLELLDLPNLVSFFPNVNVNTTTLAKSTDHLHNPMQPQPLFNEKVAFPCLKYLQLSGLQNVSDLWGSELPTSSFSKLKHLQVTNPASLRNKACILWIDDLNNTTQGLQEVAQLLYTNYKYGVLALGSNGTMRHWDWASSEHNPSGEVTTKVLPSGSHLAMTNVIGVNLEEAVPCMALSKYYFGEKIISACGGAISLFNEWGLEVLRTFMPPPPASTFLAFHPQDDEIIAIGMEDSTIRIYNHREDEVKSELKGHEKRITGLAFSTNLNILVSSAADAQLCIWRIDTWEHLKSISIPLPAGKACNGDTRVQFHSDQIRLLVSHETQLAIYDASEMDRIRQWVPQDILPAPISFAVYSCDSQLVYTSFRDGNIGVFDADSLTLACRIVPSIYLYPAMLSGGQAVYPRVVAAHPKNPNQFAIGFTNGSVMIMEPQESEGKWGLSPSTVDNGMLNDRTTSSSNTSNHTPNQNRRKEEEEEEKEEVNLDVDKDEDEEYQEENGDGPMARSMEKPKTLDDVTDKSKPWKVAETQCQLVVLPNGTDKAHKVACLLYRNGCEVLALGCNGALRLWRRYSSINNQSGMATASGLARINDVTGVNLEEAVPCMALSKNYSNIISACGGKVSLFNIEPFNQLERTFMPPPPASTFLAFHPQDDNIIAIGMEDSTIRIYNRWMYRVESELKSHKKRITGLAFSINLNILVSSGADAQLCIWSIDTWKHLKSIPIQLSAGKACNGNTIVQFHSDQIRLLVSHETQLVIYDAFKMDHIHQWAPQDVLSAPISFAAYSCDSRLIYTSFCDGNIGVFDADSLTPTHRIAPSAYSPTLSSGSHVVYPLAIATHPWKPNQFAIGLTNGSVIIMEPQESEGKWGLSSNTSNHAPDQNQRKEEEVLDEDEDEEDQEEKRKRKEK